MSDLPHKPRRPKLDTSSGYSPLSFHSEVPLLDSSEVATYSLEAFRIEQSDVLDPITKRLPVQYTNYNEHHLLHKGYFKDFVELRRPNNPADFDDLALVPGILDSEDPTTILFPPSYVHLLTKFGDEKFAPYPEKVSVLRGLNGERIKTHHGRGKGKNSDQTKKQSENELGSQYPKMPYFSAVAQRRKSLERFAAETAVLEDGMPRYMQTTSLQRKRAEAVQQHKAEWMARKEEKEQAAWEAKQAAKVEQARIEEEIKKLDPDYKPPAEPIDVRQFFTKELLDA